MSEAIEVEIVALGASGDGIARLPDGPAFVPLTVPGDIVRLRLGARRSNGVAAEAVERLADGPDRVAAPCAHFGVCGGCALQHLSAAFYAAWLGERVIAALGHRGLAADAIGTPLIVPPASRRRTRLGVVPGQGGPALGFRARRSARVVPIDGCAVLAPAIVAALAGLATALGPAMTRRRATELEITATASGLDVIVHARAEPVGREREALAAAARSLGLARLCWAAGGKTTPIATFAPVRIAFSTVAVDLPPGAFLQPTAEGEAALVDAALAALAGARRVADLFAGCGPFAWALATKGVRVDAFEADAAMVAAVQAAARRTVPGAPVTAHRRDLDRQPVMAAELAHCDGIILDPPRAGAAPQVAMLAKGKVPRIVYVSCNPASFARDARVLVDAGYRLRSVTPVGQFLWSAAVELVAILVR